MNACLSSSKEIDVPEFYGKVKSLIDELDMHQPLVIDADTEGVSS